MFMTGKLIFMLLALTSLGWAQPRVTIGDVVWYTDYDQAREVAQRENKPLWLHFGENPG
jgi:hypothetical protein